MQTVTIASGAALSESVIIPPNRHLVGVEMPNAWTAANLTFQGDPGGDGTFVDVYDSGGTEVTVTAAASRVIKLTTAHKDALRGLKGIIVRSGTAATPVNQAAVRTLKILTDRG